MAILRPNPETSGEYSNANLVKRRVGAAATLVALVVMYYGLLRSADQIESSSARTSSLVMRNDNLTLVIDRSNHLNLALIGGGGVVTMIAAGYTASLYGRREDRRQLTK